MRGAERPIRLIWSSPAKTGSTMRIPDKNLDCVIYLYANAIDAKHGKEYGGSGFLALVESERVKGRYWGYAVTNAHVIKKGYTVVRASVSDNQTYIANVKEKDWYCSKTDDLAVHNIDIPYQFRATSIHKNQFYNEPAFADQLREHAAASSNHIGVGDDVIMLGRFTGYDGIQQNRPVVRSGIISLMPAVEITKPDGVTKQWSYLIECKSLSGFSGSPVFVYRRNPGYPFKGPKDENGGVFEYESWLLGIDWGHLPVIEEIYDDTKQEEMRKTPFRVNVNSGFAGVIPVQRLRVLLDDPKLRKDREDEEMELDKQAVKKKTAIEDTAEKPRKNRDVSIPPISRKKFFAGLTRATKRKAD